MRHSQYQTNGSGLKFFLTFNFMRMLLLWVVTGTWIGPLMAQNPAGYHKMLTGMYRNTVPLMPSEQLRFEMKRDPGLMILDTREKQEYEVSHIRGAQFAGHKKFDLNAYRNVPKNTKIVVYCSVGYRSERIGEKLNQAGFSNVYNLYGGVFNWVNHHYTVVDANGLPKDTVHGYNKDWGRWVNKNRCSAVW